MQTIEIYSRQNCAYCQLAKRLLDSRGLSYTEYDITDDAKRVTEMRERSRQLSVPQLFLNQQHIGGYDALTVALKSGVFQKAQHPAQTKSA